MIRRVAITLLAVIIAAFRLMRRRKQVSAREIVENRLSVIAERIREAGDDAHCSTAALICGQILLQIRGTILR